MRFLILIFSLILVNSYCQEMPDIQYGNSLYEKLPNDPEIILLRGSIAAKSNLEDTTLAMCEKYLLIKKQKLNTKDSIIFYRIRGEAYLYKKMKKEAISDFNFVAAHDSTVNTFLLIGELYYQKGKYIEADSSFKMVEKTSSKYQYAQVGVAKCLMKNKKEKEAEIILENIIINYPLGIPAYRYLAEINIINKDFGRACSNLNRSLINYDETKQNWNTSYWTEFIEETKIIQTQNCR